MIFYFDRNAVRIRPYSFQPDLTPIGINASGAKKTAFTVSGLANNRIENDTGSFHFPHLSRSLIDDLRNSFLHTIRVTTVGDFFCVKIETTILVAGIESGQDLFIRLDADQLSWLKIE